MADNSPKEFGKRRPVVPPPSRPGPPAKRSGQVALLLMGTMAVGGGAYALMPREDCRPPGQPGLATPALPDKPECPPRGSSSGSRGSSGGGSWRNSFFSSDSSAGHSASGSSSDAGSSGVSRGGFGGFAHAFAGHSGG